MNLRVQWPSAGRYILAVSGGADSMALLDLMATATQPYELIVAHFDHGVRPDSGVDRQLVAAAAERYGRAFVTHAAALGRVSEAQARSLRHAWLEIQRVEHQALAVVTGHHQDDLLETSLLNLARGSGRRGLAPMRSGRILRPLLQIPRSHLRRYATSQQLTWHEDSTNADLTNPRNFLRRTLLPQASTAWREHYLEQLDRLGVISDGANHIITAMLDSTRHKPASYSFERTYLRDVSLTEIAELIVAAAYELQPEIELDQRLIQELALFAKTGQPHRRRPLNKHLWLVIKPTHISIEAS